jgi:hypothetical protein
MLRPTRLCLAASLALTALAPALACNESNPPPTGPVTIPVNPDAEADAHRPPPNAADAAAESGVDSAGASDASSILDALAAMHDASPADAAADFYTCAADNDCIAVAKVGCCNNGYKEAVNKQSASAYKLSFTCPNPNQICPHYVVNDTRVPECNSGTRRCEMVAIDQIKCGGFIKNQHACPDGYHCVPSKVPDMPGTCKQ